MVIVGYGRGFADRQNLMECMRSTPNVFTVSLIARDFKTEQPNQKWLTDITEFQLPAGKVWLSPWRTTGDTQ